MHVLVLACGLGQDVIPVLHSSPCGSNSYWTIDQAAACTCRGYAAAEAALLLHMQCSHMQHAIARSLARHACVLCGSLAAACFTCFSD